MTDQPKKTLHPDDLTPDERYKLMTGAIQPRPIAWVSTISADGVYNLAPFSYFTAVSAEPPTVLFCPDTRKQDGQNKDTYNNVIETGEFVVNFVNEETVEAMNTSAVIAPPAVDEFERAGVTALASEVVRPPRVAESPIHFECKAVRTVDIGTAHIVIGEVVRFHIAENLMNERYHIDTAAYRPIGRLAGPRYARIRDIFALERPDPEIDFPSSIMTESTLHID